MTVTVLHVAHAFSAQPTLGDQLTMQLGQACGPVVVVELPMDEAMVSALHPDLVWISEVGRGDVHRLRERFPRAGLLATLRGGSRSAAVIDELAQGADLVLRDEGVVLAAAALAALQRRTSRVLTRR